jgi:GTP-binding protein
MMVPVIAIIGQPNVGKSTLFNRLTKSQQALVYDMPGVTRDRAYGEGRMGGHHYLVIDTGGITGGEEGIDAMMAGQSWLAVEEADAVLFLVDGRAGLTPSDQFIANKLRALKKPVYLVVNKTDGLEEVGACGDFYPLGLGEPTAIAASHGRGIMQLILPILRKLIPEEEFPSEEEPELDPDRSIKIAIVGRPNVGKSTLVNRMLGEERVVVYDQPGTTRDSISIPLEREGKKYTIIDTAGVRRRKSMSEVLEKFSVVKTLKAIDEADVVIYLLDGTENVTDQDMSMLGFVLEAGRALVLAVNKWDHLDKDQKQLIKDNVDRQLAFVDFARMHFISALHGTNVGHLFDSVHEAFHCATQKFQASQLTRILENAIATHQPPTVGGRRIKLRFAHSGGHLPPIIVIHGNQTEEIPLTYKRFLTNFFRKSLKLVGTPLRFVFKTSDNPYKDIKNTLTPRQEHSRRRLRSFIKKKKS